MLRLYNRQD